MKTLQQCRYRVRMVNESDESCQVSLSGSGLIEMDWRAEEILVPDRMVGLIIGRGGDVISRLQIESGAKIQMAPDSQGMSDR